MLFYVYICLHGHCLYTNKNGAIFYLLDSTFNWFLMVKHLIKSTLLLLLQLFLLLLLLWVVVLLLMFLFFSYFKLLCI